MKKRIMQFTGRFFLGLFIAACSVAAVMAAAAYYPRLQASAVEMFSATGAKRWIWNLDSSYNLQLMENTNVKARTLKVGTLTGGLYLRSMTSTVMAAVNPAAAGELVYNSSDNNICISTGTGLSAYVITSSIPESTKINCVTRKQ